MSFKANFAPEGRAEADFAGDVSDQAGIAVIPVETLGDATAALAGEENPQVAAPRSASGWMRGVEVLPGNRGFDHVAALERCDLDVSGDPLDGIDDYGTYR